MKSHFLNTPRRKRPVFTIRNTDGTLKTIDQMLRARLTVRQYGQYLVQQQAAR